MFHADIQTIRISTLEKNSKRSIEEWINDWLEDGDTFEFDSYTEPMTNKRIQSIMIGNVELGRLEFVPTKWKCPECGRWNYELTYYDGTGAMAMCEHCDAEGEF